MSFHNLGLSAELLRAVSEQGYRHPMPVQLRAIPPILEGRDVLARAQTGTGKTAGFTLPLLQRLSTTGLDPRRAIRTLILTPTRELAAQVEQSVRDYGRYLPLTAAVIYGGVNIRPQIQGLRRGVDVLVATPGRLLDHAERKTVDLSKVEILVLDEADRMLDMGFIHDIRKILALLPKGPQTLLFSATFSDGIRELADSLLVSPVRVEVAARNTAAEGVSQVIHPVDRKRKQALLSFLIKSQGWKKVLVFTRTRRGASRLSKLLDRGGIRATAIHSDKSQRERTRALAAFKQGSVQVLVATDIASRGLDIDELPHVVNFEMPHVPEDYIHRIGRTARAGNRGDAVSLVCGEEDKQLKDVERLLNRDIPKVLISGYEPNGSHGAESVGKWSKPFGQVGGHSGRSDTRRRPRRAVRRMSGRR